MHGYPAPCFTKTWIGLSNDDILCSSIARSYCRLPMISFNTGNKVIYIFKYDKSWEPILETLESNLKTYPYKSVSL